MPEEKRLQDQLKQRRLVCRTDDETDAGFTLIPFPCGGGGGAEVENKRLA